MKDGCRHEYKYLISRASAQLLKCSLRHMMRPDPHAGRTGCYTIRSLYFDDPELSAYEEKVSGICHREKYRIRCYNYDMSRLKLEKKEKHDTLTKKTAQTITEEQARLLQKGQLTQAQGLAQQLSKDRRLQPMVLVDYDRTPFVHSMGNTRITLDENLRTRAFCGDLFASHCAMLPVLEPEQVILEVKFDDFLPRHLAQVLQQVPKNNLAISKYALCMDVSRLK